MPRRQGVTIAQGEMGQPGCQGDAFETQTTTMPHIIDHSIMQYFEIRIYFANTLVTLHCYRIGMGTTLPKRKRLFRVEILKWFS
jgi:hypothetical protein